MKQWARGVGGVAVLVVAAACGSGGDAPAGSAPAVKNIVLISVDTLRPDHLGIYGYERDTSPAIDALGRVGWVFDAAYAPVPRTGPSVASMLTGMFVRHADEWAVPDTRRTLAELLNAEGWRTVAAVDNANLSNELGYGRGFEVYRETWNESEDEIEKTRLITQTGLEYIEQFAASAEPFFLWLHYVNPHGPYRPPAEFTARFMEDEHFDDRVQLRPGSGYVGRIRRREYVEGERRLGYYVAQYDAEVAFSDDEVGQVLTALDAHESLADTAVVLTADHGESLGEDDVYFKHGPLIGEAHVRVPLIVRAPGVADAERIAAPVSLIDVVPTLLEMVGASAAPFEGDRATFPLAGESLLRAVGPEASDDGDVFFASRNFWGVRSGGWKLVVRTREGPQSLGDPFQLYDLTDDPAGSRNLYESEPDRAAELLQLVEAMRAIQDQAMADPDERFDALDEKAIENLRALGYVR
jgi:arylsulfatase A-like enzyme